MNLPSAKTAIIALILANIIWGAGSPLFKWTLLSMQPFTLAFLRFSLAALVLLPFVYRRLHVASTDIMPLIMHALMGISFNIAFFFLGLKYAASINAPIIASSAPIFIILLSWLLLRERPRKKVLIGTFLGLLGVLAIIVRPLIETGFNFYFIGNLLFIFATFGQVGHTIFGKEIMAKYSPTVITFWSFIIGAFTFFPLFFNEVATVGLVSQFTTQSIIGLTYGVLLSSTVAYLCYNYALKYMHASEVGVFIYIDPISAILLAAPLLGELPTPTYVLGAVLVFLGIYIAEGRINYHPITRFFHLDEPKQFVTVRQHV